jgi:hypothetical protein
MLQSLLVEAQFTTFTITWFSGVGIVETIILGEDDVGATTTSVYFLACFLTIVWTL